MNKEDLIEYKKKIAELSEKEKKLRDLELRKYATGELQGPPVGYASIDKPWLKHFDDNGILREIPNCSAYEYLCSCNKDYLNQTALNYYDKEITYKELFDLIDKAATSFVKKGIKKGDVVSVVDMINPELVITLYALNKIGAVINLIDVRYSGEKLTKCINDVDSKMLIVMDNFLENINDVKDEIKVDNVVFVSPYNSIPTVKKSIATFMDRKNQSKYKKIKSELSKKFNVSDWNEFISSDSFIYSGNDNQDKSDEIAAFVHTGGTTGVSKIVKLSNRNFNAMPVQFEAFNTYKRNDTFLDGIVPFVAYGVLGALHLPLCLGLKNILAPLITPEEFTKFMIKYQPNNTLSIPTYWDDFFENDKVKKMDWSSLKHPGSGGDATSPDKERKSNEFFSSHKSNAVIELGYGMTEVGSAATACVGDVNREISVGVPLVNNNLKIVDPESGDELLTGEIGEVCLAAPTMMLGYLNNKAEEDKVIKNEDGIRWIHSGDLGYVNKDGFLYIVGRIKRMIIRGGFKLYPSEIENSILKCDMISQCCVVSTSSEMFGTEPVAYVVLKDGVCYDESELKDFILNHCKKELPEYSIPYDIVVIDKMPLTSVGKVDYKKLESDYEENKKLVFKNF